MSNFATHFSNMEEIPMGHLFVLDKLKKLRQVENPDNLPSWIYSIANLGIIIFIIVLVIICYVFLLCHYVMLFSACIIYVTAIAFMCFANKHIIIIIIIDVANFKQNSKTVV